MIAYTRNEIFPATRVAKAFGAILDGFKKRKLSRAVVSKNNRIEAVILPVEVYEEMREIYELIEHMEIAEVVGKRKNLEASYSLKDVLRAADIDENSL